VGPVTSQEAHTKLCCFSLSVGPVTSQEAHNKLCCFSLSVGPVTSQEAHTKLNAGTIKLQENYKTLCRPMVLQETETVLSVTGLSGNFG
jgi:hypothetical protein